MLTDVFAALGAAATLLGILTAGIALKEWRLSKRIQITEKFPLEINRSVRFSMYVSALNRYVKLLRDRRSHPDVVVGIHYGGIASAADVARRFYGVLLRIEVRFEQVRGEPHCTSVIPHFAQSDVAGRRVLLVDNRIKSGTTMHMAERALKDMGAAEVRTLVIFRPSGAAGRADDVLFAGRRNLRHLLR